MRVAPQRNFVGHLSHSLPNTFCKSSFGTIFRVSFQLTIKKNGKCHSKVLLERAGYFLHWCLLFIIQLDSLLLGALFLILNLPLKEAVRPSLGSPMRRWHGVDRPIRARAPAVHFNSIRRTSVLGSLSKTLCKEGKSYRCAQLMLITVLLYSPPL